MDGSTPRPGTVRSGITSDASPALAIEKLTGIVPAAAVSISGAEEEIATERTGCWDLHAITPGVGGGSSPMHVQPPCGSTHARNMTSGAIAR
ncbi:MAG: hypothetical protein L6Q76_30525 [Polyangiaceae bacterium]|nr:hypothetical protein [Polyangiaceae bacterium]